VFSYFRFGLGYVRFVLGYVRFGLGQVRFGLGYVWIINDYEYYYENIVAGSIPQQSVKKYLKKKACLW